MQRQLGSAITTYMMLLDQLAPIGFWPTLGPGADSQPLPGTLSDSTHSKVAQTT